MNNFGKIALLTSLALGAAWFTPVSTAQAQSGYISISVGTPPPPARWERMPPARPGFFWVRGYWYWDGFRYLWIGGRWEHYRPGYAYTHPRWVHSGGRWVFHRGYWEVPPRYRTGAYRHDDRRWRHYDRDDHWRHDRRADRRDDRRDNRHDARREHRDDRREGWRRDRPHNDNRYLHDRSRQNHPVQGNQVRRHDHKRDRDRH